VASSLTKAEIQALIDKLNLAIANDELEIEDADGYKIKYKNNDDILKAIKHLKNELLSVSQAATGKRRNMGFRISGGKGL